MGAVKDYLQRVNFQLATVQFPNQLPQNLTNSWSGLTKNLMESAAFGQQIKKNLLKNDAMNAITANAKSPFRKNERHLLPCTEAIWHGMAFNDFYCTSVKESYAKKQAPPAISTSSSLTCCAMQSWMPNQYWPAPGTMVR